MTPMSQRVLGLLRGERSLAQLLLATVGIFILFSAADPRTFPSVANLQSMAFQFPETGLLGLGVMLSMVTGGIDLSMIATADLAGLTTAEFFHAVAGSGGAGSVGLVAIGILIALAVGVGCGMVNGLLIGKLHIPPILATLATLNLFGGLAIAWTGGQAVVGFPDRFLAIGNASPAGVPAPLIIFVAAVAGVAVLLNWYKAGLLMTLVGANPIVAQLSGIRALRVLLITYGASGVLAAMAGVIIVSRTASATPDYGQSYILLSIVIAVLAGVDPNGGFGTVTGVVLATLCLVMVQTGFIALGFSQFFYEIAQGAILIAVLAFQAARGARITGPRQRRGLEPTPSRPAAPPPGGRPQDVGRGGR
jgi:simple sugar transport system permease protein